MRVNDFERESRADEVPFAINHQLFLMVCMIVSE